MSLATPTRSLRSPRSTMPRARSGCMVFHGRLQRHPDRHALFHPRSRPSSRRWRPTICITTTSATLTASCTFISTRSRSITRTVCRCAAAYRIDAAYVRDRFNAEPRIFTYLRHGVDSGWWRAHSLRFHYDAMQIPSLLVGGQLDGYRDAIPRMLDSVRAPVKALIGPWKHDDPGEADPGPSIAWRELAIRWWDHWLKGRENGVMDEPRLTVFVRDPHVPDASLATTPGHWRFEDWPIARTVWRRWYAATDHWLTDAPGTAGAAVDSLHYRAGVGTATPVWWGDATGDMAADDGGSLVYDSPVLRDSVEMIGLPRVRLRVTAPVPVADWTVRWRTSGPTGKWDSSPVHW